MSDDTDKVKNFYSNGWWCFLAGLVIAAYGIWILQAVVNRHYDKEAIEHGYGQYHPKTGKFIWNHELEVNDK